MARILAAIFLLALSFAAGAVPLADRFTPGTPYYFDSFDPLQRPWVPGRHLNIEEVFKNYRYYEILFDRDGAGITVNRYLRGSASGSERYLVLPDGSLRKDERQLSE